MESMYTRTVDAVLDLISIRLIFSLYNYLHHYGHIITDCFETKFYYEMVIFTMSRTQNFHFQTNILHIRIF